MADHPLAAPPAEADLSGPSATPTPSSAPGGATSVGPPPRDYYEPGWWAYVAGQHVDETQEPWYRMLPVMRVYGFVVLAVGLLVAYPRNDPSGWRGPASLALVAALAVAFWLMWERRPIWEYGPRTLAAHGVFQLAAYATLVSLSWPFAVLQLVVYPQILFRCRSPGPSPGACSSARSPGSLSWPGQAPASRRPCPWPSTVS